MHTVINFLTGFTLGALVVPRVQDWLTKRLEARLRRHL